MALITILLVIAGCAYAAWHFLLDHRTSVQVMHAEDGGDPLKQWARAAYVIVNGKFDPGSTGKESARAASDALLRDWGITNAEEVSRKMAELAQAPSGNPSWDHVRRIVLARMAAAAGHCSQEASWASIQFSRQALLDSHSGWEELSASYRKGLAVWSKSDEERMAMFDLYVKDEGKPLWAVVPFRS